MLYSLLMVLNVLSAVALVLLILLQRSETGMGGAFGAGSGGGAVSRNPLAKPTAQVAAVFLASCLAITVVGKGSGRTVSVLETNAVVEEVKVETQGVVSEEPAVPLIPAP